VNMNKPKFNPNQPFEVVNQKPKFDPSQPFEAVEDPQEIPQERGLLSKGLEYTGRVLDYPGGLLRTGIAQAGEALSPKSDIVTKEDWSMALKGKAPTSAEYLERAGLEPGPSVELPILGDTSLRDVEGFALDVATDPLSLVAKGLKPVGRALEGAGKSTYRSAFKKIDERTAESGAKKLADVLLEHGAPTGTTKKISGDINNISSGLLDKRSKLYKEGSDLGAKVDVESAMKDAIGETQRLKTTRGAEGLGQELEQNISSLFEKSGPKDMFGNSEKIKLPPLSLQEASELKTRLYDTLPQNVFDRFGRVKGDAKKLTKLQARGLKEEIVKQANAVKPGLGDEIDKLNIDLGALMSSKQPLKMQIRRGETPNALTSVDAMLGALASPGALATKKAADLSKTTYLRTKLGKGLMNAGKSGRVDQALERSLINMSRPEDE